VWLPKLRHPDDESPRGADLATPNRTHPHTTRFQPWIANPAFGQFILPLWEAKQFQHLAYVLAVAAAVSALVLVLLWRVLPRPWFSRFLV
jgi:hypothetical protein